MQNFILLTKQVSCEQLVLPTNAKAPSKTFKWHKKWSLVKQDIYTSIDVVYIYLHNEEIQYIVYGKTHKSII